VLPARQKKLWEAFYESTINNGLLDQKTTVMMQSAASFAIGWYP